MSKQDRQGARTPADLERRYKFGERDAEMMQAVTAAEKAVNESNDIINKQLPDKVGREENDYVVEMINKATTVLKLTLNRLVVDSDNFKLLEDGSVEVSGTVTAQEGKIGDWHLGAPSELSEYYAGTALYSDTYTENSEELTVYMTPEKLYVGKRSGLEVSMDSVSWADIVRVVNGAS